MPDDDLKQLESELLALVRRIYDAGAKAALHHVVATVQTSMGSVAVSHKPRPRATGYGAVSAPVRDVLIQLAAESPEGVGARDIAQHFERRGSGPDERQVRAALKTLSITGEAIRASRGRYLPRLAATSSKRGENSDAHASEPFDQAAE